MIIMKVKEASTSRIYDNVINSTWAIVSPYRGENDDKTNKSLMSSLKSDVRSLGYGFVEFVSRWVEDGEPFDEKSLLINNCKPEEAIDLGVKYHQSSVIIKDGNKCVEVCTNDFESYKRGDVVRTFNLVGDTPMNYNDAKEIFEKRKGGPASKPIKESNPKAFRLSEVYTVEQPRPSYFHDKSRVLNRWIFEDK